MPKEFTSADVQTSCGYARISCDNFRDDLEYDPPAWFAAGLQETATGYGSRLNSGYFIRFNGKRYRVYITCWSNSGTAWFKTKGRRIVVS